MTKNVKRAQQKMMAVSVVKSEHFKLYKSGKLWLVAGLATLSLAAAPQVSVHAATVNAITTQVAPTSTANSSATTSSAASSAAVSQASTASAATKSTAKSQAASQASTATATAHSAASTSTAKQTTSTVAQVAHLVNNATSTANNTSVNTQKKTIQATPSSATTNLVVSQIASNATTQPASATTSSSAPVNDHVTATASSTTAKTAANAAVSSTYGADTPVATGAANHTATSTAQPATSATNTTTQVQSATDVTTTLAHLTTQLPEGTALAQTASGVTVNLPVGTDVDVVKRQLGASGLVAPITVTAKDAAATYSDTNNKVNVTLSTDKIGYDSGADVLMVGLHMTVVAGDTLSMTFPTDSPIIKWGGLEALPTGVGVASTTNNADGTTTYNVTIISSAQVDQDITLNLASNAGVKTVSGAEIGITTQQITWKVNGVNQTPIKVTQTISPATTISAPSRVSPKTIDVPKVAPNSDYVYAVKLGESTGAKDDTVMNTVVAALNTGGATVKIPVPTSFALNEAATATYNQLSTGTTITQPDGKGGDVIISVAAGKGGDSNFPDHPYYIIGQYKVVPGATDTTLTGNGPIIFTQTYDNGQSIVTEGPTWTETLKGDAGNTADIELHANGNSGTSPDKLVLDSDSSNDPTTLSNLTFELNASAPVTDGKFTLEIPDGIDATSITVPNSGIMIGTDNKLYLPDTTSYAYTLTLTDGTVETGSVNAGGTITPQKTASIQKVVLIPNYLAAGAYITGSYQIGIHGTVATAYANGAAVKNDDQLTFKYQFSTTSDGTTITTTANKTETITAPVGHFIAWQYQHGFTGVAGSGQMPGGAGVLDLQQNGTSGQTTDQIYEPILYFVVPKNATITDYVYPSTNHPTITTYQTDDGRTGVKMDFTGTGEYINTYLATGTYGIKVINSLDALSSTSQAAYYVTSPNTIINNTTKVTDLSLTDGDANAVLFSDGEQNWTVTTASVTIPVAMAQGNLNTNLVASGTADVHGDENLTYAYNLVNNSSSAATNAAAVINLPTIGDALGSTFTFNLTGPITVPTVYTESGAAETVTVKYATSLYTAAASSATPDLTNFVTADQISDWSTVRAVYVAFDKVPAMDTTGRVLLNGTAADFIAQGGKIGYLNTFTYDNGAPVSTPTAKTAANITINGTSTVTARIHYKDGNGADQFIALDDLTKTLKDNQDKLTNNYPKTIADFSATDQALLPKGYSVTGTTIVNSTTTYPNNMANDLAVLDGVSQYYFDGDIVQIELTRDAPVTTTKTITKTIHYQDEDGNTVAPDYTDSVTIKQTTDPAAGTVTYDPSNATLGFQADPTPKGYTLKTDSALATSSQQVTFGSDNIEATVVYTKNPATVTRDTVSKTVHYQLADGTKLADDYTTSIELTKTTDAVTSDATYDPETAPLAGKPDPTIKGYHVVTDSNVATATQTVKYGDADIEVTVVYAKDTPKMVLDTVTKTVHYMDQDGHKIADDYVSRANITELTDAVTGAKTYGPENAEVKGQANPTISGYHVVTDLAGATSDETVVFGDKDLEYTVVYNKDTPKMNLDTITKTVHYVDQDNHTIAPDYVNHVNITESTDPVTGDKTYGPATAKVAGQANPTISGYHVVTDPAGATSDETVVFGDKDLEYTVVYNKDTPKMNLDTITKTVHYVDQDDHTIAPDYVNHVNITESTDPVTGDKTYGPATAKVAGQANPTISGYHVVTDPAGATSDETVVFGDKDLEYTVVYNKDTPKMNLDTITKTVHYVDQDDHTIAPDYVNHVNITESTDPVTGDKTYGPATAKVAGQANPTISGYHVVTDPAGATSDETVVFGDKDLEYTVVYNKDTPKMNLDTITKTVHYVDQDDHTIAPDYVNHVNITESTDPVTGDKTYGPATAKVAGQANPTISGYHVVTDPAGATSDETVVFGDKDLEYTVVYNKDTPKMNLDTITKTVHYVDQDDHTIAPDYVNHVNITESTDPVTGDKTYGPATAKVAGQANPTISGYHVVTDPAGATSDETVVFGDKDLEYTVVYNKDTPKMNLDTITKTVHYVDQDDHTIAPDYVNHVNITESTDPVTGDKTYGPATVKVAGQANPTISGYHVVTDPAGATSDETVVFGDKDLEYTVVYNKDTPKMTLDTVTKTVYYVDQDGNQLAPDYTSQANFTETTDPVTGTKSYGPETAELTGQANPTIAGYHVFTSQAGTTTNETVKFGDPDQVYTVVYVKDAPKQALDTVTKTVYYVDQDGNQLAPDYTSQANFTEVTDPVTGAKTYAPETAALTGQANPTIAGYHVFTSQAGTTTSETVKFGDPDQVYTVVYVKDAPKQALDTVTKTVHYVDQDGNQLAPNYTSQANFTEVTDPVTGDKTYGPETAALTGQANPTIAGYHVFTSRAGATTSETVKFGDPDQVYTVVYVKDAPKQALDTVTKTVHYIDQDGNQLAPDYTSQANFTEVTDPVTGAKTYAPETAALTGQANPTIAGYHVFTSQAGATTSETVKFGDPDQAYTVIYVKDAPKQSLDTVTKTVHYVDQDGNTLAPDYTSQANFTEVTDPVTGAKTYAPETAALTGQTNPVITGYHVVTNPAGATTTERVKFGAKDVTYTVVYAKDTPKMSLDTITKTVHYVDLNGNTIAPDYTAHVNITELVDPVTGAKTYGPAVATLAGQANPVIAGYHVAVNSTGATTSETVQFGDADLNYTVVYATIPGTPGDNGGMTPPDGNENPGTPGDNGGMTPPDGNENPGTPGDNGGMTPPDGNENPGTPGDNGGMTPPDGNENPGTPGDNGGMTPPDGNENPGTPGNNGGMTPPDGNENPGTPGNNGGMTPPNGNENPGTPGNNGGMTPPDGNENPGTPGDNGGMTPPDGNENPGTPAVNGNDIVQTAKQVNGVATTPAATATAATTSTDQGQVSAAGQQAKTLPQTGADTQPQLALLGASMLALLGLTGYRRKRN